MNIKKIKTLLNAFSLPNNKVSFETIHSGYINKTYLIQVASDPSRKFILQNINTHIFPDVDALMSNTMLICEHIKNKLNELNLHEEYTNLHFHTTVDKNAYLKYEGAYYCLLDHIDNQTVDTNNVSIDLAAEMGKTLGLFHQLTSDIDPNKITEIIPNFHRLDLRYAKFKAINLAGNQRYKETVDFYKKVLSFEYLADDFKKILSCNELPIKVVHNDPKLSNILFDKAEKGITMIDLDTVMPGFLNADYGDAIRSLTNTSDENERGLEKVGFNFSLFKSFTLAYLNIVKNSITAKEKEHLALFVLLITYEQLVRFYGDFLEGDVYYQTLYPMHNLQRSKVQLKLLQQMVLKFDKMRTFIQEAVSST